MSMGFLKMAPEHLEGPEEGRGRADSCRVTRGRVLHCGGSGRVKSLPQSQVLWSDTLREQTPSPGRVCPSSFSLLAGLILGSIARKPNERRIEKEKTCRASLLTSLAPSWPQKEKGKRLNSKSDTTLGRTHTAGPSVTVKLFTMSRTSDTSGESSRVPRPL